MDGYQRDPQHREDPPEAGQQPAPEQPAQGGPGGGFTPPGQDVPVYDHLRGGYGAQPPQRGRGLRTCLLTCLVVGVLGAIVSVVGCMALWRPMMRLGIDSDMVKYRDAVRASQLDEARKQLLVHKIEHLRDVLEKNPMGMMDWVKHTDSLDTMVDDGLLTAEEADLLEKEMDRMAQALGTEFPPLPEGETPRPPEGGSPPPAPPAPEPF